MGVVGFRRDNMNTCACPLVNWLEKNTVIGFGSTCQSVSNISACICTAHGYDFPLFRFNFLYSTVPLFSPLAYPSSLLLHFFTPVSSSFHAASPWMDDTKYLLVLTLLVRYSSSLFRCVFESCMQIRQESVLTAVLVMLKMCVCMARCMC